MNVARSAIETSMFWCRRLRRPPSEPYQFFIAAGVLREVVVLGDRHVDDLVGVDERRVDRPLVEHVAVEAHACGSGARPGG